MKISQSPIATQLLQGVDRTQNGLAKVQEKLATGRKINRAQDDAAGLAIAEELDKMGRGYKAAGGNIADAMAALNIAEGSSQGIQDMLGRMGELSVQAANATLSDTDRQALNEEFQQLKEEIGRQAQATEYNGQNLLDGSSPLSDGTGQAQVGPNADDGLALQATVLDPAALGIEDLDISTAAGAQAAIDGAEAASQLVNETRVTVGSEYNRLGYAFANNDSQHINTVRALSTTEDLDFADALMQRATDSVLAQSAIMAQANFQDIARSSMLGLLAQ
jgi:flagellin